MEINISPSLFKKLTNDICPKVIYYDKIEKIPTEPSLLMLKGRYFEHHLIGGTVDGEVPELPKLKNGNKSADEKNLDELIEFAKKILQENNIDLSDIQLQVRLEYESMSGVIDFIGKDFTNPSRLALYDLKYTETRVDDRWNGFADIDNRPDLKFQAIHYIRLAKEVLGIWMPYYFLIFGKSMWAKIIKVVATEQGVERHNMAVISMKERLNKMIEEGFKPKPSLNRCQSCEFNHICEDRSFKTEIETIEI